MIVGTALRAVPAPLGVLRARPGGCPWPAEPLAPRSAVGPGQAAPPGAL